MQRTERQRGTEEQGTGRGQGGKENDFVAVGGFGTGKREGTGQGAREKAHSLWLRHDGERRRTADLRLLSAGSRGQSGGGGGRGGGANSTLFEKDKDAEPAMVAAPDDLEALPRRELQALAKQHGVRANQVAFRCFKPPSRCARMCFASVPSRLPNRNKSLTSLTINALRRIFAVVAEIGQDHRGASRGAVSRAPTSSGCPSGSRGQHGADRGPGSRG